MIWKAIATLLEAYIIIMNRRIKLNTPYSLYHVCFSLFIFLSMAGIGKRRGS
jgi:hypothetical protein